MNVLNRLVLSFISSRVVPTLYQTKIKSMFSKISCYGLDSDPSCTVHMDIFEDKYLLLIPTFTFLSPNIILELKITDKTELVFAYSRILMLIDNGTRFYCVKITFT